MTLSFRSRITGLLTCLVAGASIISVSFARSVFRGMLDRSGTADLPRPTVLALAVTHPWFLLLFLLFCLGAVAVTEATVKTEATRILVQVIILLVLEPLLAVALSGFFVSFYIPKVPIP